MLPGNILISGPVTLSTDGTSGNPQITLGTSNAAPGEILAATGGGTLNNNVWISGVGQIGDGDGTLTLNNKSGGLIQANPGSASSGTLIIDLGHPLTNTLTNLGTLEAANGGTLELSHTAVSGGHINVDAGGTLLLSNADLSGVTVDVFGSGTDVGKIEIAGATTITDSTITDSLTDSGAVLTLTVDSGATLTYDGADTIDSTGSASTLQFDGGGNISLASGSQLADATAASGSLLTLDNVNNDISGAGTIGNGDAHLALTNEASGTVDANVSGATLAIDTADSNGNSSTLSNAGLLEATNGGELSVHSVVDNTGGTVTADAGFVDFELGISGGSATITDSGKLEYGWSSNVATTFNGAGTLQLDHQNQEDPQVVAAAQQNPSLSLPYGGTVTGFGAGDAIDLTDLSHSSNETATWSQNDGKLTITDITQNGTQTATINLAGTYTQSDFALTSDSSGGTEVVWNPIQLSVPGAQTIGVGQATAISGVGLSESGNTTGETFTATLTDTNGALSATAVGDGDTVTVSGTTLTIIGSLSDVNTDLGTLTDTAATAGPDTITVNATDSNGNSALQQTIAITAIPPSGVFSGISGTINNSNGAYRPQISTDGSTLELTNGGTSEAGSWFDNTKVSINSFTASFDYQAMNAQADGMAFILQNDSRGSSALGARGGSLGYSSNSVNDPSATGITPSAAVEFNLFNGNGETQGTNFVTNDTTGNYNSTLPVDFWDTGDTVQVVLSYNGSVLTETLTDLTNSATYTATYDENLTQLTQTLGADTAYVGFSAATGGSTSTQTVSNFTFQEGTSPPPPPPVDTWSNIDDTSQWLDASNWTDNTTSPSAGEQAAIIPDGSPKITSGVLLDNVSLQNGGTITVTSGAILTLDDGTTITNGTLSIGSDFGDQVKIEANGSNASGATLDNVNVQDSGNIQVDDSQQLVNLVLSDGTVVDGMDGSGTLTIGSTGKVEIKSGDNGAGATFDDLAVTDNNLLVVNSGAILTLDGATLSGTGTVGAGGNIHLIGTGAIDVTHSSTINQGASLSGGTVKLGSDLTLTLDNVSTTDSTIVVGTPSFTFTAPDGPSPGPSALNLKNVAINNAGDVLGGYQDSGFHNHGFIYTIGNGGTALVDDPAANGVTYAAAINGAGEVVGDYAASSGHPQAFLDNNGFYTDVVDPSAVDGSYAVAINDAGTIAGYYLDNLAISHLFIVDGSGHVTNPGDPSGATAGVQPVAINRSGEVVGDYSASDGAHGFIYSGGGGYTTIDDPNALDTSGHDLSSLGTVVTGINAAGDVVGTYYDGSNSAHGFIYSAGGYTDINDPLAVNGTYATGINDAGEVVGYYRDSQFTAHGFVYSGGSHGVFVNFSEPDAGGGGTIALAINNAGQVVGYYTDASSNQYDFIANPQSLAAATLLLTDGTTVAGGTLTINPGNTAEVSSGEMGSATLDNVTVGNAGTLQIDAGAALFIAGTVMLEGGGAVSLASGSQITEVNTSPFVTLDNIDNEISGAGTIGGGGSNLTLNNAGTVDANVSGQIITIDTADTNGSSSTLTNTGTLEATGGGGLSVHSIVDNTGGKVAASGSYVDFLLGISGGSARITGGGTLQYGWSSNVNTAFAGAGTLRLDHQNQEDPQVVAAAQQSPPLSLPYSGTVSDFGVGDTLDLTDLAYATNETATWTQGAGGGTLTINSGGQIASVTLAGTYVQDDFVLSQDNGTGTDVTFKNFSWGELKYPAVVDGVHQFGVNPQYNSTFGKVVLAFGETSNYSTSETSLAVTRYVEALDPFFLPGRHAPQTVNTSPDVVQAPSRYELIVPNVNFSMNTSPTGVAGVFAEGIYVYKGQVNPDGTGGNAIWEVVGTPDANGDGGVTLGTPTQIGNGLTGETIYNLTESFKDNSSTPATASSFDVAWDQYNSSTGQYNLEVQLTPINPTDGTFGAPTTFSPVITEGAPGATSVTVADTALPAWHFRPASGGSNNPSLAYVLAVAEIDTTTSPPSQRNLSGSHDAIHFQGYTAAGGTNSLNFTIQPNLHAYAHDGSATNAIVQPIVATLSPYPGQAAQALDFVEVSPNNSADIAVAWNETVTDSNGAHDQVEFAVVKAGTGVVSQSEFQIADGEAQNIRVGEFADPFTSGQDDVVVVYGDDTGTHINEYAVTATGNIVTLLDTVTDPTAQAFDDLTVMGDGRIAITYNDQINPSPDKTSQNDIKIFDLRTAGVTINDSSLTDGQSKYFAGTHYNDTVTGENSVNNEYYFVGQNTVLGPAAISTFNGGTGGWNTAIFGDDAPNFTITAQGNGYTIANFVDPAHGGQLTVNANVEALAFNPAQDPNPAKDGSIEATGDTLMVLHDFANAAAIAAGATLEFKAADSGNVTFDGGTGALVLDQANNFSGAISNFTGTAPDAAHSDVVELVGYNDTSHSEQSLNGNLVLTLDGGGGHATITFDNFGGTLSFSSDTHGDFFIADPPATSASPDTSVVSSATADGASGDIAFADANSADTFSTNVTPDGSNYVGTLLGRRTD